MSELDYFKNLKNNFFKKKIFIIFLTFILFLDRHTKNIIIDKYLENQVYINEYINFDLIWNTGMGFGLLSTETSFLFTI